MRDVERRARLDVGGRVSPLSVDVAVAHARRQPGEEVALEEDIGAAGEACASADCLLVVVETDQLVVALVIELDARDALLAANLRANDGLAREHRRQIRRPDRGRIVERLRDLRYPPPR